MSILVYWGAWLLACGATMAPGVLMSRALLRDRWSPAEHLALGPILGIPVLVAVWLVVAPRYPGAWAAIFLGLALSTPVIVLWPADYRRGQARLVLAAVLGLSIVAAAAQMVWDAPTYVGGDFFHYTFIVPWRFVVDGSLAGDRPALLSLYATGVVEALGGDFTSQWLFQTGFVSCNALIAGPAVLIAGRLGGTRAAAAAALLVVLNPFLVHQTMYAWPKLVASVGVLGCLYLLFLRDDVPSAAMAGWMAAVGYLCHQVVGLLILPIGLVWLVRRGVDRRWARTGAVLATGVVGWGLYVVWASRQGYEPTSRHLMCVLATDWWEDIYQRDPGVLWAELRSTPLVDIVWPRFRLVIATFTPFYTLEAYHEAQTIPAATGIAAFVTGCFALARRRLHGWRHLGSMSVALLAGTLAMAAFAGCFTGRVGLAFSGLHALVAFVVLLAALYLARTQEPRTWLAVYLVEYAWATYWWVHRMNFLNGQQRRFGNPLEDDFLERDLSRFPDIQPSDVQFADDFVRGHRLIGWLVAAALFGALLWWARRSLRSQASRV